CYVLKTDLTPQQANKETVHDRYKDLASVEQAFRTCKTAHLEVRPIFVRREARTRAHAFVVMLAYQIIQYLTACWSPWVSPWKKDSTPSRRSVSWKCRHRMPPAIPVSPHRTTPSRTYCTAPTSRSPRPFPSLGCGCPLGKNCSLNVCISEYSYLPDF